MSWGTVLVSVREYIAHLPIDKRERLAGFVRAVPAPIRYGPVFRNTRREIIKAHSVPSWGRMEQERRLGDLLRLAAGTKYYSTAAGYSTLQALDQNPREILGKLPILTREELSAHTKDMLTVATEQVEVVSSSGTSGEPIVFHLDKARGAGEWAYVQHIWNTRAGYELDDWRVFLRGAADVPNDVDYYVQSLTGEIILRTRALSPDKVQEHWDLIKQYGIHFIHGYPSAMEYLAKLIEKHLPGDKWRLQIKGLLTVSEEFTRVQAEVLARVFPNARVANFYGLSERTVFAGMDSDWVFHPEPLYGVTEILNQDGSPTGPGERGRIVTTGLRLTGQPFLRYDTGDSAEVVGTDPWGCPTFKDIKARRGREGLVRDDGSLLPTTSLTLHSSQFAAVARFRFRQDEPGRAALVVEPSSGVDVTELNEFLEAMQRRSGNGVVLNLEIVERLEVPQNGKNRLIDQNIPGVTGTWA
ncbi:AMP-binding protein [Kocuria sp. JC486]|uniref:AMP-binding protein n=1 Tax=Kocuria sp. JC486 TaxID=1970736 RepID=UPI0032AEB3DC